MLLHLKKPAYSIAKMDYKSVMKRSDGAPAIGMKHLMIVFGFQHWLPDRRSDYT